MDERVLEIFNEVKEQAVEYLSGVRQEYMDERVLEIFNEVKEQAVEYLSQIGNYDVILQDANFRGGQNRWCAKLIRRGNFTNNAVIGINLPNIQRWVYNC